MFFTCSMLLYARCCLLQFTVCSRSFYKYLSSLSVIGGVTAVAFVLSIIGFIYYRHITIQMYEEELLKRMKHKVDDTDIESQTNTNTKKMNNGMEARNLNYSKLDDESDSDDASSSDSSRSSFDSSYEDSSSSSSSSSHSDNDESNEDEEKDQPEQEKASIPNGQVVEDKNTPNQDSTNVKPNGVAIEIKDSASTSFPSVYNAPTDTEKTLPENTSTESKSEKMKKRRDCEYTASVAYRDLHGIIVLQSACLYVCVIHRLFNSQQRSSQGLCFFRLILKY